MKNILITGACGFIGSNLLNSWVKKYSYYNFFNLDALYYVSTQSNILKSVRQKRNYTFIQGNLQNQELVDYVLSHHKIDTIIHLAAQTNNKGNLSSPVQYVKDNILGTQVLLEAVRKYGRIQKFIYVSSDQVSPVLNTDIFNLETLDKNQNQISSIFNSYAFTQNSLALLFNFYLTNYQLPIISVRLSTVYGPREYIDKFIPKFITKLLENQKYCFTEPIETIKSFLYIDDLVGALECLLLRGKIGVRYDIGSYFEYSIMEIARRISLLVKAQLFNKTDDFNKFFHTSEDIKWQEIHYPLNFKNIEDLGWKQNVFIQEGLEKTVSYYTKIFKKENLKPANLKAVNLKPDNSKLKNLKPENNYLSIEITDF